MVKYFFDSYAVVELMKGNPNYARYANEEVVLTFFNLAEKFWGAFKALGGKKTGKSVEKQKVKGLDLKHLIFFPRL